MGKSKPIAAHARVRRLLAAVVIGCLSAGAAFGRDDDTRRERVTADDDPIVLPVWVAAPELTPRLPMVLQDPDTTGSVAPRATSAPRRCDRVAWYPERGPQDEYRETC